jgi:threonine dehydratase
MAPEIAVDLAAVRAAHARIRPHVHRTPVLTSRSLDAAAQATLFFKCENLQKVGAFKARGACNAVFSLDDAEASRGVVTHSSGNHGAAVAWAAARRGIPAWVVMPENSAQVKKAAVQGLGATVRFCAATLEARDATCAMVQSETGALLVHPYDDWRVIAGQGTAALELLEQVPDLDAIITPVGGGGLLSGTAIASRGIKPSIRSLQSGHIVPQTDPRTICDGLRSSLGPKTFAVLSTLVDAIGTTSEEAIVQAMRLAWDKLKLIIEPSSAVPLAALLERKLPVAARRVGIVVSGGNVDLDRLPWQR